MEPELTLKGKVPFRYKMFATDFNAFSFYGKLMASLIQVACFIEVVTKTGFTVNTSSTVKVLGRVSCHVIAENWKHLKDTLEFLLFLVSKNQNSAESGVASAPHSTPIPTKR